MPTAGESRNQRRAKNADDPQGSFDLVPSPWPAIRVSWCRRVLADREIAATGLFTVGWAIAEHVNTETGIAFPSQATLAREVHLSDRQVRRLLGILVARGHLVVVGQRPRSRIVEYRLARPDERLNAVQAAAQDGLFPAIGNRNRKGSAVVPKAEKPASATPPSGHPRPDRPDTGVLSLGPTYRTPMSGPSGLWSPDIEPQREPQKIDRRGSDVVTAAAADGVSDAVDYPVAPQVAADRDRRRAAEREWRAHLGAEPVLTSLDAETLHDFVATSGATQADVLTGIDEAMTAPGFRITRWRSLIGWVRKATERRALSTPKAVPMIGGKPRDPSLIRFPDGYETRAEVEAQVASWRGGRAWNETRFGFAPDSEFTDVPADLRGPRRLVATG